MSTFPGFSAGKTQFTPLPVQFFTELLGQIDHLAELKVTLYAIWYLDRQEGDVRFLQAGDIEQDAVFMKGMADTPEAAHAALEDGLARAVRRGALLQVLTETDDQPAGIYFLNSPRGRAAVKAFEHGAWVPGDIQEEHQVIALDQEKPNIFRLYEENMGPLTPLIAETLTEAEKTYPPEWVADAIHEAVKNNVRRWRYVEAILRSWQENGRNEPNRRNSQEDRRRYVSGEFGDFIEH